MENNYLVPGNPEMENKKSCVQIIENLDMLLRDVTSDKFQLLLASTKRSPNTSQSWLLEKAENCHISIFVKVNPKNLKK